MKTPRDIFCHFPMQVALGLYTLHQEPEEDEEEGEPLLEKRKESGKCTQESTTSITTSDTRP